mgnify:CR=1 FL=1
MTVHDALPDGATPLDAGDLDELIPPHITTRGELDAWEQSNIVAAERWLLGAAIGEVLDDAFVLGLHRRMFDQTWRWAGRFRRTDANLGVAWQRLPVALRELLDDGRLWRDRGTSPPDESAVRLHHRLVQIHCFPNGNGRHARLWADVLLDRQSRPRLDWGGQSLDVASAARDQYLAALRAADRGDYAALLLFARGT